jgi:predicted transcriptional regulator
MSKSGRLQMAHAPELVFDLIFGRWRSQILYSGAALGVFDQLSNHPTTAAEVAKKINADPAMLYRLMRALGSIGLLIENDEKAFSLTDAGALLCEDHPHSLRAT